MDMRVTVTDWHGLAALNIRHIDNEDRVEFGVIAGSWADPAPDRTWIELRLDLTASDGADLTGFTGVTGFADLDGGTTGYNEGWELISGFDTVYTMADAHLTRYGDNGWAGSTDENEYTQDDHGLKHYIGATFDSTSLTVQITAAQENTAIYQDIATIPGAVYTWSLKHASLNAKHVDAMSVMIGEPGHETPQEAERVTVNGHGDQTGPVGTVIRTKVDNQIDNQVTDQWETYEGTYVATGTVTRFTFKAIEGVDDTTGNKIDDISFQISYPLTYDLQGGNGIIPNKEQ